MKPENLKLLFDSYLQCRRNQDECDGVLNHKVECDGVTQCSFAGEVSVGIEQGGVFSNFFPYGQAATVPNAASEVGRRLAQVAEDFSNAEPDKSIIKFKDICVVVEPTEQSISVLVIRDPKFSQKVTKVSWKTNDKTALSGTHYVQSHGEILFNQGELSKDITIQILNSADEVDDLRFTIELCSDCLYNPKPMTVSLKKINNFYSDEMTVLRNLPRSLPFTILDIKSALDDCLTNRTFHVALTHLCSTNTVVDVQFALALELSSLCLRKMRDDSILNVLTDFFRLDDIDF